MAGTEPAQASAIELARQLAEISRALLTSGGVEQTLIQIVELSVLTIDGCVEVGLCAARPDAGPALPTSPLTAELDRLQEVLAEGPCVDALGGQDSVYVEDLSTTTRWPAFGPRAAQAGLRSALAYRLFVGGDTLGALQLYARLPGAFDATDRAQGLIFAAHAGLALGIAQSKESERGRTDNLQLALVSREVIGQAQGILMERERIPAEQAFDLLRRASQRLNVKLRDVAQGLVDTGQVPEDGPDHPAG